MNKRALILAVLIGLALAGVWLLPRFSRTAYGGRYASDWLGDLDTFAWLAGNTNAPRQAEALAALRAIGPAAVPVLEQWFGARDRTGWLRRRLPLMLRVYGADSHARAVIAIEAIGTNAAPMVPFLVTVLADPARKANGILALAGIGPAAGAAVPALVRILEEPDPGSPNNYYYPWAAAVALTAIGTPALPAMTKVLSRDDLPSAARVRAAWVLGSARPRLKPAIPALLAVARAEQTAPSLLAAVIGAVGQIGADNPLLVEELRSLHARRLGRPLTTGLINGQFALAPGGSQETLLPPGATNLDGWAIHCGNIVIRTNRLSPELGTCLELGPRNPPGAVAQAVLTRPGGTYELKFLAAAGENSLLAVSAGNLDTTIRLARDFNSANNDTNRFAPFTLRFQAISPLSTIVFRAVSLAEFGPMIDEVTLEPVPVDPAPRP